MYIHIYIYVYYIYICVCYCECVYIYICMCMRVSYVKPIEYMLIQFDICLRCIVSIDRGEPREFVGPGFADSRSDRRPAAVGLTLMCRTMLPNSLFLLGYQPYNCGSICLFLLNIHIYIYTYMYDCCIHIFSLETRTALPR